MRPAHFQALCLLLLICSAPAYSAKLDALQHAPFDLATQIGSVEHPDLRELSGLIRSNYHADYLWALNDSGALPQLFALSTTGENLAVFDIEGATNIDWEDLAIAELNGERYLVIADIGDNLSQRSHLTLYFVLEPRSLPKKSRSPHSLPVAFQWNFRYEEGARDAEAIAFDVQNQHFLILSKRDLPPRLYQLDVESSSQSPFRTAKKVAELTNLPQPEWGDLLRHPISAPFSSQPTAMDLSPDGTLLAILTYRHAYLYRRTPPQHSPQSDNSSFLSWERWAESVKRPPELILYPSLLQAEALTFDFSGEALYISSEFSHPPLILIEQSSLKKEREASPSR
jgi:hypothetical protein